jgi:hypothetical protein
MPAPLAAPIPPFPQTIDGARCDCQVPTLPRALCGVIRRQETAIVVFDTGLLVCSTVASAFGVGKWWAALG